MTTICGVTGATRVTAEAASLVSDAVPTTQRAANKAQGKDEMDDEDYVNIMVPRAFGEGINGADAPARDWAFPASPLERLLNEPSLLDRLGGD